MKSIIQPRICLKVMLVVFMLGNGLHISNVYALDFKTYVQVKRELYQIAQQRYQKLIRLRQSGADEELVEMMLADSSLLIQEIFEKHGINKAEFDEMDNAYSQERKEPIYNRQGLRNQEKRYSKEINKMNSAKASYEAKRKAFEAQRK